MTKVIFRINGTDTEVNYDNGTPPYVCARGGLINFTVIVYQGGSTVSGGDIRLYDWYNNSLTHINTYTLIGTDLGYHNFTVDTSNWHAGLHLIKVYWSSYTTFNSTYIIIDEKVNIQTLQSSLLVQRNVTTFTISGDISEYGNDLRGLGIELVLLESGTLNDVSQYLIILGGRFQYISDDGTFSFVNIKINESCPYGDYYIRIDYLGDISHIDLPRTISLNNFMVHSNSSLVYVNVTAGTKFVNSYYYTQFYPPGWFTNDICHIVGNLTWDNNTGIVGVYVNVSVQDGFGVEIASKSSLTTTDGYFDITFTVGSNWDDDTRIFISFYNPSGTIGPPESRYYEEIIDYELFRQS